MEAEKNMRVQGGHGDDCVKTGVEVASNGKPVENVVPADKVAGEPQLPHAGNDAQDGLLAEQPSVNETCRELVNDMDAPAAGSLPASTEGERVQAEKLTSGIDLETPMILAVQHILTLSGMAFSLGAVRDLPELTGESFDPQAAVSALRHVGFEASYGELAPKKLRANHCPAIGFLKSGEAVVIHTVDDDGHLHLRRFEGDDAPFIEDKLPKKELSDQLEPFIVLARKVHAAAKPKGK
ncbi:MAG: hypothetical protein ABF313_16770, partial [Marivita sp.]